MTMRRKKKGHRDRTMEGNLRGIPTLCLMEAGRPIPGKRFQASGISLTAAESGSRAGSRQEADGITCHVHGLGFT